MGIFYVYQLRREDQDYPFYIGKGKGDRAWNHLNEAPSKHHNPLKIDIISKAKSDNIKILVEFIAENLDEIFALRLEVWAIKMWGRLSLGEGPLTNLTDGGEGGQTLSDPFSKQRFMESMARVNALPETKRNRTNAAKEIWNRPGYREAAREERRRRYLDPHQIKIKKFQSWTNAKDKWINAIAIYDAWIERGMPSYKRFEHILVDLGYPKYNLQKMVNYFRTVNIRTDQIYLDWLSTVNEKAK